MTGKPDFVTVESVTGKTLSADGAISLDVRDLGGRELVVRFKPSTHIHLLQCLLPRGSAMSGHPGRVFAAEQAEFLQSPRGDLGIRFLLSGGIAMTVELPIDLVVGIRDQLNSLDIRSATTQ